MADRTNAEKFGRAFQRLARHPTAHNKALAEALLKESQGYGFDRYQMHADDALVKLGLLDYPEYPADYPGYPGYEEKRAGREAWADQHNAWVHRFHAAEKRKLGSLVGKIRVAIGGSKAKYAIEREALAEANAGGRYPDLPGGGARASARRVTTGASHGGGPARRRMTIQGMTIDYPRGSSSFVRAIVAASSARGTVSARAMKTILPVAEAAKCHREMSVREALRCIGAKVVGGGGARILYENRRVELPSWHDAWVAGARYGAIESVHGDVARVKLDRSDIWKTAKVPLDDLRFI